MANQVQKCGIKPLDAFLAIDNVVDLWAAAVEDMKVATRSGEFFPHLISWLEVAYVDVARVDSSAVCYGCIAGATLYERIYKYAEDVGCYLCQLHPEPVAKEKRIKPGRSFNSPYHKLARAVAKLFPGSMAAQFDDSHRGLQLRLLLIEEVRKGSVFNIRFFANNLFPGTIPARDSFREDHKTDFDLISQSSHDNEGNLIALDDLKIQALFAKLDSRTEDLRHFCKGK